MILQRLAEHYDRMQKSGKVQLAPPGYSQQKVSFCVVLEPDGRLNSFEDLRQQEGKVSRPTAKILPGGGLRSGTGAKPYFLWDTAEYMLGWTEPPKNETDTARDKRIIRAAKYFNAFRSLHLQAEADGVNHQAYAAVCAFLRDWSPDRTADYADRLGDVCANFGVFRIAGEQLYVHELVSYQPKHNVGTIGTIKIERSGMCLISGQVGPLARLHEPKIKGVATKSPPPGGASLVSFNEDAFTSYGKEQSFNAPVSTAAVLRYTKALNYLLEQRDRRIGLGDATVVFWADHSTERAHQLEDALADFFGTSGSATELEELPQEDLERVRQARVLLTQLRDGTRISQPKQDDGIKTSFFILGLSPNASRLSIRLWVEADASELERRLGEHLQDFDLKGGSWEGHLPVWRIANATGRYNFKKKKFETEGVSPQLIGELARSVFTGAPYPQSLLSTMVRRIRSDAYVGFERVSAIKACLIRNSRLRGAPLEVSVELDEQQRDLAYRCGRIFAVLERAQEESVKVGNPNAKLNATIKDRYFGGAAATPLLVLPRLLVLNGHHLRKLEDRRKAYFNRLLGLIMDDRPFTFPHQLTLQKQGDFIIGYFQQRQDFFKSKPEKDIDQKEEQHEEIFNE